MPDNIKGNEAGQNSHLAIYLPNPCHPPPSEQGAMILPVQYVSWADDLGQVAQRLCACLGLLGGDAANSA